MDFTNRNQQAPARPGVAFSAGGDDQQPSPVQPSRKPRLTGRGGGEKNRWFRLSSGVLIVIVALLIAAVLGYVLTSKPNSEESYVNSSKLQAVFLTNDQVYFGNVSALNSKYLVLHNIYYLQSSSTGTNTKSTTSNGNVSLVKLGCELHRPYDQMVINRSEVEFWENLQSDGQVAKAVAQYEKANPNGQTCTTTPSSNPVQGTTGTSNTTNTNSTTNNNTNNTSNTKQ